MIEVQTWRGSGSARITDMTNAYTRGKRCRVWSAWGLTSEQADELYWRLAPEIAFDNAVLTAIAVLPREALANMDAHEIKAVEAPRPTLTAQRDGVWSATADAEGLHIRDLADHYNEPTMITAHSQAGWRAYELAKGVWENVRHCITFSEVGHVLEAAGCRLHYYCAVD